MSRKTLLTNRDVDVVFRGLAEQHLRSLPRPDDEATWRLVQEKQRRKADSSSAVWRTSLAWAASVTVLASIVALWLTRPPASLSYELSGGQQRAGQIDSGRQGAVLAFSDRSRLETTPGTQLSVSLLGEGASIVRLLDGQLHARVKHASTTNWRFLAGPYEVHVVGTEFTLRWDKEAGALRLAMIEGVVRVEGSDAPQVLKAGQSLVLEAARSTETASEVQPHVLPAEQAEPAQAVPPRPTAMKASRAPAQAWGELVAQGRFSEVVSLAEQQGMASVLASAGVEQLAALAQAAHYSRQPSLATRAWTSLRQRFAGAPQATRAAFYLGRLSDQTGQTLQALQWFEAYLREAPAGVYASEASGRKLILLRKTRGAHSARGAARDYLRRFPDGAYTKAAHDVLGD